MCLIFNWCRDTSVWLLGLKSLAKGMKERQIELLIAFVGYANDLNKLQQFNVSVQITPLSTSMHFSPLLAIVCVALLRSSWRSSFLAVHNASDQLHLLCLFLLCRLHFSSIPTDKNLNEYAPNSNSCIFTPTENWTHDCMNLFAQNSPYYHLLKYLLFLLKHPVYVFWYIY
jgi:L-lactate permease